MGALADAVQNATGNTVDLAGGDHGDTRPDPAEAMDGLGIELVVRWPGTRNGFVLLPRPWVGQRSFAWTARASRLVKDDAHLPGAVAGLHVSCFIAFCSCQSHVHDGL